MGAHREKRDRTARLLRIQVLLGQKPEGLEIGEIAAKCSTSVRTVYRDLEALESELHVPIWSEGGKRGVVEGYHLPPLPLTIPEAMNIALAARLMQSHSFWYDPHRASMLMKLKSVVPSPMRKQIQNTVDWVERQPRNEKQIYITEKLAEAWVSQHGVRIIYRELYAETSQEFIIEPYFIEPATPGNSGFVIANHTLEKSIRIFKIKCIENVYEEPYTFTIPASFDATAYISSAWGIFVDEPVESVKLRFQPQLSRPIMEAIWNPSQIIEPQSGGSMLMTLRVAITNDFRAWVLGWGDEVEVIEPETFRNQIIKITESTHNMYARREDLVQT